MSFAGMAADHAPFFLRHAVVWYLLKRHRYRERVAKILGPIFDERKRLQKELGEERWKAEKPNDAIQWVLDATANRSKEQQSYSQLAMRIITLNFAAIHTTTLVPYLPSSLVTDIANNRFPSVVHFACPV